MNTHHHPLIAESRGRAPSRLLCRIVRQWVAVSGERNPPHVASCAACQEYFRAATALDRALRDDAMVSARATPPGSEDLERQIMQAVRNSTLSPSRMQSHAWGGRWAFGGLATAAALVIATLVINRETSPAGRGEPVDAMPMSADAAVIVDAVETLSNRLVDSVIPSAGELVAKNPLQQEIGSVYSDMRSALDFLALNFMPPVVARPAAQPVRTI